MKSSILSFGGMLVVFLAVLATTTTTHGCTSPSNLATNAGTCSASSTTTGASTSSNSSPNKVFGVPEAKLATAAAAAAAAAIRGGGEVQETDTHKDVQDIITKAGINNQLVVIDFTATYVPVPVPLLDLF